MASRKRIAATQLCCDFWPSLSGVQLVFGGFPCPKTQRLAGRNVYAFARLWITPWPSVPYDGIEDAQAGHPNFLTSFEGIDNCLHHGVHRLGCIALVVCATSATFSTSSA
jgi:hypothetical protein